MASEHTALFKLGVAERIQLVEDLWDSIARDEEVIGLPASVKEELHRRKDALDRNPESARTWEQIKYRIRKSHA